MSERKRPSLKQMWDAYRGPVPTRDMQRGLVLRVTWWAPFEPSFEPVPVDPNPSRPDIAEFRFAMGALGWVLLGRWSDESEWMPILLAGE